MNTGIKQDFDYEKKAYNTKRASKSCDQGPKPEKSLSLVNLAGGRKSSGDEGSKGN